MPVEVRLPVGGGTERTALWFNRLAVGIARHWLLVFNTFILLFIGPPFLAPVLVHAGAEGPARLIYTLYRPTCHQLPERSLFLFGPEPFYSLPELEVAGAFPAGLDVLERTDLRWIGDHDHGYKVAVCQRDIAIYGAVLIGGLLFGLLRRTLYGGRMAIPKLPFWAFALLLLPMALDGGTQLFGLRESTWGLRFLTGALAGGGAVWLGYPYIEESLAEVAHRRPGLRSSAHKTGLFD